MNISVRLTRVIGFVIVALTIAVAAAGFFVVRKDIDAMSQASNETILWSALQVEIELLRFENSLAEFKSGAEGATPKDVNTRFDILWSRVSLFRQGTVGKRLSAYDTPDAKVAELFAKMQALEPTVTGLKEGDKAAAETIQQAFRPFQDDLRELSRRVLHGEERRYSVLREDLSSSSGILTIISAIAVLSSVLLIFVFARETHQFRQLAEQNRILLEASRLANKAKSQFLSMMSHELRTPMNGVLGLLALIKQQGLSGHQNRLMDQAERSGVQMIGLLKDILDFSALQDDQLKLDQKPFEIRNLVTAIKDMFGPVALREGIEFDVRADRTCPDRVIGDFARLRQALTHLATYILETAGASNIAIDLAYGNGALTASISFDYSQIGGEWEPELIMGNAVRKGDSFASEALGPAVSRGLIERMGGSTKLNNPTPERIAVLVSVPAPEMIVETLLIKVVTQSGALEAICRAAFRAENVRFLADDDPRQPHVVMIEAGGEKEAAQLKYCAMAYPQAILVALGKPQDANEFDDFVEVPIDIATVRQAAFMQLASGSRKLAEPENLRYAGH